MWTVDPTWFVEPSRFPVAEAIELVMHVLLKGSVSRGYNRKVAALLGLRRPPGEINAQQIQLHFGPMQIIDGALVVNGEELGRLLGHYQNNERCARIIAYFRAANQFFVELDQCHRVEQIAEPFCSEVINMVQLFQMSRTNRNPPDISFVSIMAQPIVGTSIVHVSGNTFIDTLTVRGARGYFREVYDLLTLMDTLRERIPRWRHFKPILLKIIEERIEVYREPFRFSFGPHTEYIIHVNVLYGELTPNQRAAWKRGLTVMNIFHISPYHVNIRGMIRLFEAWRRDNPADCNCVIVAQAIQTMFEQGIVMADLPGTLQARFQQELENLNNPVMRPPPAIPREPPLADDDMPLLDRVVNRPSPPRDHDVPPPRRQRLHPLPETNHEPEVEPRGPDVPEAEPRRPPADINAELPVPRKRRRLNQEPNDNEQPGSRRQFANDPAGSPGQQEQPGPSWRNHRGGQPLPPRAPPSPRQARTPPITSAELRDLADTSPIASSAVSEPLPRLRRLLDFDLNEAPRWRVRQNSDPPTSPPPFRLTPEPEGGGLNHHEVTNGQQGNAPRDEQPGPSRQRPVPARSSTAADSRDNLSTVSSAASEPLPRLNLDLEEVRTARRRRRYEI